MDDMVEVDIENFLPPSLLEESPPTTKITQKNAKDNQKPVKVKLKKDIQEYYLHQQLAEALIQKGEIPKYPVETTIGVGFVDIANYSYLSKWLSPRENQHLLNGLYSAFNTVLRRRGGFLNKMEGDSLMFHYGGIIDPNLTGIEEGSQIETIAAQLFYTCVEIQRACYLFNIADKRFIEENKEKETQETIEMAYNIISTLRDNLSIASQVNAMFQVQVRVGASIGEVSIGNFGPKGKKQWDIIGQPVIEARRMESTAPIGGLRISKRLYDVLDTVGIIENFHKTFTKQATTSNGYYRDIEQDELFKHGQVILKDKRNETFDSYSVQVNPQFPELLLSRVKSLFEQGEEGIEEILDLIQYYRGNRLVINAIDEFCTSLGVELPYWYMLKTIYPKKYDSYLKKCDFKTAKKQIAKDFSLYEILKLLGNYQDILRESKKLKEFSYDDDNHLEELGAEYNLMSQLKQEKSKLLDKYKAIRQETIYNTYFYKVTFPLIFTAIKTSFLTMQQNKED